MIMTLRVATILVAASVGAAAIDLTTYVLPNVSVLPRHENFKILQLD